MFGSGIHGVLVRNKIYLALRYRRPFTWLRLFLGILKGDIRRVPVASFINIGAFSFGQKQGWHPYTAVLRQIDADPEFAADGSVLQEFYQRFMPGEKSGFLPVHLDDQWRSIKTCYLPPWGGGKIVNHEDWFEHWTGPKTENSVKCLFNKLKLLYVRIKAEGYRPLSYPDGLIGVCIMEKSGQEFKTLVVYGQHRAAILSHLGYDSVWVSLVPGAQTYPANMPQIIKLSNLDKWQGVTSGQFVPRDAASFFNCYFEHDGRTQATELGLLGSTTPDRI